MIFDISEVADGATLETDLCIVGAGPAGISLAQRLTDSGIDILLLESGGYQVEAATQRLHRGIIGGLHYPRLEAVRLRQFGGTTGHWAGQSSPLEPTDFSPREWVPHSGWPIVYSEFSRYLQDAGAMCLIPDLPFSWDYWQERQGAPRFPFDPARFDSTIFRYPSPVTRFGAVYKDALMAAKNVRCLLHANVMRLVPHTSGRAVSHLNVGALDGKRIRVKAGRFVLAGGGIENSRMLLLSPADNTTAIGNQHDQVGRYFMEHPAYDVGKIRLTEAAGIRYLVKPRIALGSDQLRVDFKLNPGLQKTHRILNHTAYLAEKYPPPAASGDLMGQLAELWGRVVGKVEHLLGDGDQPKPLSEREFALRVRLEQAPNPDSRITLADATDALGLARPQLSIKLTGLEGHTIAVLADQVANELGRSGLGRMHLDFKPDRPEWLERVFYQNHHCGGTRMHGDPRSGVVDTNCRVHGMDNLYVAGSSVFPAAGHANPTMNMIALALRLADHLKREVV